MRTRSPCAVSARSLARLALLILVGLLALAEVRLGPVWAQGMSPGGSMRDMMRQMMKGQVPPPGMTAAALPGSGTPGSAVLVHYCTQCHDLPSPRYKTAEQWPAVFERMVARMRMMSGGMMGGGMMGNGRLEAPDATEAQTLLAYLLRFAMVPATRAELQAGDPFDRAAFQTVCTRCHALPSPALHGPDEWPGVVARMRSNMQLMERPPLTSEQVEAIVRYLKAATYRGGN
jgi:cytochrome c5